MRITLVAAVDEGLGLGKDQQLLCHLPADLQHFKAVTLGKPIIMGYKTWVSIGRPLPKRHNIVLSRQPREITGGTLVDSLDAAMALCENEAEVCIIGGRSLFESAMPLAHQLILTHIHHRFDADVFFPTLTPDWVCVSETYRPRDDKNHFDMTFRVYRRD